MVAYLTKTLTIGSVVRNMLVGLVLESSLCAEAQVTLKTYSGEEARPYWREIASLRIDLFQEFPYLYKGSFEEEKLYLEGYFSSQNSSIMLVFDGEEVVGFSSSIPLLEVKEVQEPFVEKGLNLGDYLYIGEAMIRPAYRGVGILRSFSDHHEKLAAMGGYSHTVFITVEREPFHPARPVDYRPLEPIWERFGYRLAPEMRITWPWQRVDTQQVEENALEIWMKQVSLK